MKLKQLFLNASGFLLLGLGAVGIFLPILPTTPFVLASAACFTGDERLRSVVTRNKFFAEHMENYRRRTGLSAKTVAVSLGFLWATMFLSAFLTRELWMTVLLICVGIAVTVHILCVAKGKGK